MKLKKNFMKGKTVWKQIVSMILVIAMVLTMMPVSALKAQATESDTSQQSENQVTVYFDNTESKWSNVYGYAWIKTNSGTTDLKGGWPGEKVSALRGQENYYKLTCDYTPDDGKTFNFIFNNNSDTQTKDLTISNDAIQANGGPEVDGRKVTFTYENASASQVYLAGSMNGWSTNAAEMKKSDSMFTYTMELDPGLYEYKFVVDGNWVQDSQNPTVMVHKDSNMNSVVIVSGLKDETVSGERGKEAELPTVLSYVYSDGSVEDKTVSEYKIKTDGAESFVSIDETNVTVSDTYDKDTMELTATTADGATATVTLNLSGETNETRDIIIHFANTAGWEAVCGYMWNENGDNDTALNGNWPGQTLAKDENGYYTMQYSYRPVAGQSFGYIFHNNEGKQTVDLNISYETIMSKGSIELWVQPEATDENGKYTCAQAWNESEVFISPQVNGKQVTFRYQGNDSTQSVQVYGSMNNWAEGGVVTLSESGNNVFTGTATLDPGVYQYKFVVDKTWMSDPKNPITVGKDGNSVVVVSDEDANDTNTVTIKLHYTRNNADYTGWNVWAWWLGQGGQQYDFVEENNERVATITLESGRATSSVSFKIRLNQWEQEEGERKIDVSKIVSGTVHYYVNSSESAGTKILGEDAIVGNKISSAKLDYETGKVTIETSLPVDNPDSDFVIYNTQSEADSIEINKVESNGCIYTLTLSNTLDLVNLYKYKIRYDGYDYGISTTGVYATDKFAKEFTYTGDDLGATWSADSTTFKVWAPTAEKVEVQLYSHGSDEEATSTTKLNSHSMTRKEDGVWTLTLEGNWKDTYYTYLTTVNGEVEESCDPYARTTGVNGERAMIIDLDSTDPEGWDDDVSPNQGMSYTDAVIYELHVRDFSIDDSSGVSDVNQGKFLAFTEDGTTLNDAGEVATGIDYLTDLGVTHLHLLPVYDYASIDETLNEDEKAADSSKQFNWGYDPENYNVPEGSYSTNAYDGNVRVAEMKQMVQALHENNINVIMDVVYNHVYDAGNFCFNEIVPDYFSRKNADGSYSNGSGCGNDTASEREMVRKYIVESVMYWAEEYHIDGFRFDLVGLLDAATINEIVDTVHKKYPNVIFYGEGWTMGTAAEEGTVMATQANSGSTPNFAYFSDTIRNLLAGENGKTTGFVSGTTGKEKDIANCFKATTWWCKSPTQTVNYASCHDNYTLMDKLVKTRTDASKADLTKMNNLAAAIYMMSEGIPFIHAGEEFLRQKLDENGNSVENSYKSPDSVNSIDWNKLEENQNVSEYYQGLIEFRKNHAALRLTKASDVAANVQYNWIANEVVQFVINGQKHINGNEGNGTVADEVSDGIVVIFNATTSSKNVNLPNGEWKVCIDNDNAGAEGIRTVSGSVNVAGISAMVLVQGKTIDEDSVYIQNRAAKTADVKVEYPEETEYWTETIEIGGSYTTFTAEEIYEGDFDPENYWILKGWKDQNGNEYVLGEEITVESDLVLTPIVEEVILLRDGDTENVIGYMTEDQNISTIAYSLSYDSAAEEIAPFAIVDVEDTYIIDGTRKTVITSGMEEGNSEDVWAFAGWFYAPYEDTQSLWKEDWSSENNVGDDDLFGEDSLVVNHSIYAYWIQKDYLNTTIAYYSNAKAATRMYTLSTVPDDIFQNYGFVLSTKADSDNPDELVIGATIDGKNVANIQKTSIYTKIKVKPFTTDQYANSFNGSLGGAYQNGTNGYISYGSVANMPLKDGSNATVVSARAYYTTREGTIVYGDMTQETLMANANVTGLQ